MEQLEAVLQESKVLSSTQPCTSNSCAVGDTVGWATAEPCLKRCGCTTGSKAEFQNCKLSARHGNTEMTSHKLNVTLDGEILCLQVSWLGQATAADAIEAINHAVHQGFSDKLISTEASKLDFKYQDEDGDWCTLVEETIPDFLEQQRSGTLKLAACFSELQEEPAHIQCGCCSQHFPEEFDIATPPRSSEWEADEDADSKWSIVEAFSVQQEGGTLHIV